MFRECKAPSEYVGAKFGRIFGELAHQIISEDYRTARGGVHFFPAALEDFRDIQEGFGNVSLFIAYLGANHLVDKELLASKFTQNFGEQSPNFIPDLMTNVQGRQEFYEIKPNSKSGRKDGRDKVVGLLTFFQSEHLTYEPGLQYEPDRSVTLWKYDSGLFKYEVKLHYFRIQAGLVVYEVCTEIDGPSEALKAIGEAFVVLIGAILIKFLLRGRNLPPNGSGRPEPWPAAPPVIQLPPVA
jgi:hypothetical protein